MPAYQSKTWKKSSASAFRKLVYYLMHDRGQLQGRSAEFYVYLMDHGNPEALIRQFQENDSFRKQNRRIQNIAVHQWISFHPEDRETITHEMLEFASDKWIELVCPNSAAVVKAHLESEHIHLHVVHSTNELFSSKGSAISKERFERAKKQLDRLLKERYPELKHSFPEHGRGRTELQPDAPEAAMKDTTKLELTNLISAIYQTSSSLKEFVVQISRQPEMSIFMNRSKTQVRGVYYRGQKYRLSALGLRQEHLDDLRAREHPKEHRNKPSL